MNAFMIPVHQLIYIYKLKGAEGDVLAWTTSFMYRLIEVIIVFVGGPGL